MISHGQHCQNVMIENVFLFGGHQSFVHILVFLFEGIVAFDLKILNKLGTGLGIEICMNSIILLLKA